MAAQGIVATGKVTLRMVVDDETASAEDADVTIDSPGVEGYTLGRTDSTSNYRPDIDLTPFGGQQKGISRRHAALVRYQGLVHILDLGSMNGTYINGKRLSPQTPYLVNSGDEIGLANLVFVID